MPGSFRDRSSRVYLDDERVFRALSTEGLADWRATVAQPFFQSGMADGRIVRTWESVEPTAVADEKTSVDLTLEHERIPLISYPFEWSFGMLKDAALLHLDLMEQSVPAGVILKDASAYNIQFRSCQPVFMDVGSFQKMAEGEPWVAYRQFCEHFLFPLMLQAWRGIDFHTLLRGNLEGIPVQTCARLLRGRDYLRSGSLTHVWLHALMERMAHREARSTLTAMKQSRFPVELILHNIRKLRRLIQRLKWQPPRAQWVEYDCSSEMVSRDSAAKQQFVEEVAATRRWKQVWDTGCNRGRYSLAAAPYADLVVAMDRDHGCIELLYQGLKSNPVNQVLPLVIDVVNSSPAQGWRGQERTRLEHRGSPDLILCLGLIHHLVISASIPLKEVLDWLSSFRAHVVLEFPTRQDPMVQALLRNKREQYADYSLEELERLLPLMMRIQRREQLPSGERHLFHCIPLD